MNEKKLFPDYEPKKTPDTLQDYLREPSIVFKILSTLPTPVIDNLKSILEIFQKYEIEAKKHPGGTKKGNVAIGADPDQYYPSDEELIVSELGKIIEKLVKNTSKDDLSKFLEEKDIKEIEFNEIYFRHVDVMGSGRFFYAEKAPIKTVLKLY